MKNNEKIIDLSFQNSPTKTRLYYLSEVEAKKIDKQIVNRRSKLSSNVKTAIANSQIIKEGEKALLGK